MTEHHRLHPDEGGERGAKGLKKNAITFVDGLIIGIASTAPAYSLAAGRRMGVAAVPEEAV